MEHPLKILILEDSKIDAEIIQRLLMKQGAAYEFSIAMNREKFLLALDDFFPDVILSDNSLPGFNATDALKITRRQYPHIPFILVTGTVSEEYAANIIKEGADDYILKDRMSRLHAAIEAALNQRKIEKEIADYRYALDQSAIVAITDQKGIILYANENFCRISKYRVEELIGQDHRIINSGYHPASYIKNLWQTIANGKIWRNEFRNKAKDGSFYWVDTTIVPFLNLDGKPYQYLSIRKDITERKKAEEQLLLSEEKYRTIFLKSPLPKWVYDTETFRFLEVNEAAIQHYGYTREEFLSMTIKDIRPKEDVELLLKDINKIQENSNSRHGTWKHLKKNGELITVETTAHSLEYNSSKARMVVINDVTEKLAFEQQTEFDSNNLKALINNTKDLMWSIDRDLKLITFNDSFNEVITFMSGEQLTKGRDILSTQFTEDQRERYRIYYEQALNGDSFTITDHFDGPVEVWAEISFYPIRKGDEIIGTACFSRDITERKKSEQDLIQSEMRLNEAQAITHISNWEIDLENNIHTWSDELYRIYGLSKTEVTPSIELFLTLIHPDDALIAQKIVDESLQKFSNAKIDFRFIRSDGQKRYGHIEWRFELDKKGTPLRVFGILQDITEHKEAEENLKILEEKILEQKIEEQKKIARAIMKGQEKERNHIAQELHDNINQILAGTKIYLSIAGKKSEEANEIVKYPMELIDSSIEEIRLLCQQLVTPLKDIDLEELIRNQLCNFDQHSIKTAFTYAVPGELLSDDLKLNIYRIIQEQVNNILKYAEAKNVIISIQEQDKTISIHVEDDGKGFDANSKRKGIGISNIINRAETFNGKVKIKSSTGKGCKINVTIPCY